jgi:hypothetical protein
MASTSSTIKPWFKSETEAKNWIARKSKAWLKKQGYADDLVAANRVKAAAHRIADRDEHDRDRAIDLCNATMFLPPAARMTSGPSTTSSTRFCQASGRSYSLEDPTYNIACAID